MSELRWESQRGEWVIVAPQRQDRTYHPPAGYCPLCPTQPGGPPTEIPAADFEIAVFENQFPALSGMGGHTEEVALGVTRGPGTHPAIVPAYGHCEVVVYSPVHEGSLGQLPVRQIERLLRVWTHRYEALSATPGIRYVFIFENRGEETGVTLSHPHGQIYAFPFLPPIPEREQEVERAHYAASGHCLHCHIAHQERSAQVRVLIDDGHILAYVPFAARWPFQTHIVLRSHRASLLEINAEERCALAASLQRVLRAYDALFDGPMPYVLAVRQQATAHARHPAAHLRIELLPARRAPDKLKLRAGSETVMGVFINDIMPEQAAERLRAVLPA